MYNTNSEVETQKIGAKIATKLKGGDILLLSGDLGAGKTSLVKGIAKALGIKHEITSPTFTLMNVYQLDGKTIKTFVHIDTYRLKDEKELIEIGLEDYLGEPNTVCVIEWPEKIIGLLKNKKTTFINFEHGAKAGERKINIA